MQIDLEGLRIVIDGFDADLARRMVERYAPYSSPADAGSSAPRPAAGGGREDEPLRVRLGLEEIDYFIVPPEIPETNPVLVASDGDRVRYLGYRIAGWFDARGGRGEMLLSRGTFEPDLRAIENYIRAATAWQAASRGGALVHAASAVHRGNGYLFFSPSGAGKSTLSAANTRARVLSDDLSLVLPRPGGGLDIVGSPFRGTYTGGPPVIGRFPLVHGFRLVQDSRAEVREVQRARAFGELDANLPFVVDAFPKRPDLFARFEEIFAPLPLSHLHFRKDDSYWDAIERAGL